MQQWQQYLLQQMGIELWQWSKNQRQLPFCSIAESKLVIISNQESFAYQELIANVVKSFGLTLKQVAICNHNQLMQQPRLPLWVWCAGCACTVPKETRLLNSVSLAQLNNSPAEKRLLWQQICRYQNHQNR